MKKPKQFVRINMLMSQVDRLRKRRDSLQTALTDTDAKLADLEVEWTDLQKDISNAIFGRASIGELKARERLKADPPKKKKKKQHPPLGFKKKGSSRAEIQAVAKKRDERLISILKQVKKRPHSIHDLHDRITTGAKAVPSSFEQLQSSLKRMRKKIKRTGNGRATRYTLKGKK